MEDAGIRLVTRGDDCGMCPSANAAIRDAFENGIPRNASVMVPCLAFEEVACMLADLPGLSVGLHVTLNAEWDSLKWGPVLPTSEVPSLVDSAGFFLQTPQLLHQRQASVEEMMAEVRAQLELARRRRLEIRYLDQHMDVGWLPGLGERLCRLAKKRGSWMAIRRRAACPASRAASPAARRSSSHASRRFPPARTSSSRTRAMIGRTCAASATKALPKVR